MKNIYESAEMSIVLFDRSDVIAASQVEESSTVWAPVYSKEDNETEMM